MLALLRSCEVLGQTFVENAKAIQKGGQSCVTSWQTKLADYS